jgi:hypothetical protein
VSDDRHATGAHIGDPATDPQGDATATEPDPRDTPEERGRSLRRAASLTAIVGIVFSILFTFSFVALSLVPGASASDQELNEYYLTDERTLPTAIGLYILPFAGIAFLWFIVALRMWAAASVRRLNNLQSNIQLISGIVFVTLIFVGAAASSVLAVSAHYADGPIDPVTARQFPIFGQTIIVFFAMRMAAMFVFTTSALARSSGIFPRWFTTVGFVVGLFLLISTAFTPLLILVFPGWVFVASVILLRKAREIPRDARLPPGIGGVSNPIGLRADER